MKKDLPKVYASPINKSLNNNKDIFYSENGTPKTRESINVLERLNEIFASKHHVYKSKVKITTLDNTYETYIVGRTSQHLLTLDGTKISLNSIQNIEKI